MKEFLAKVLYGAMAVLPVCGCSYVKAWSTEEKIDAVFEYREIYLPESMTEEGRKLHLNHLDDDWGLWGHNLSDVLPKKPDQGVYARVNGQVQNSQFCFSSNELFDCIVKYIDNRYDDNDTIRFAILPNDNRTVCRCSACVAAGNTPADASPAVFGMIRKLAKRFPNHIFFTSYYNTTRSLPAEPLPDNCGVLISTMDSYPLAAVNTPQEDEFAALLRQWSEKTSRIYIWDYINNFDDYFTPFPVFEVMQRRLKLYAQTGVKGVFLNGSGTDFSSFCRVKTYILAELTRDPDYDWRSAITPLCVNLYPAAGEAIADFMVQQEDYVLQRGKKLPLYDGVDAALKTYLPEEAFLDFCDRLNAVKEHASANEKKLLQKYSAALGLTQLEIMRLNGDVSDCDDMLYNLSRLEGNDVYVYNEACWTVDSYVKDYTYMYNHAEDMKGKNLLKGVRLKALNPLDEDYSDISIITDGLLGLPSNYHCGNLISSADPSLSIEIPATRNMRHVRVCLVRNQAYHISRPIRVRARVDGHIVCDVEPQKAKDSPFRSFVEFDIPESLVGKSVVITLVKNPEARTMAIDEIEGYDNEPEA